MNNSLQVHEETASNYFHRGNLLKQSDKLQEAAAYQRCTELNQDFSWYHHNLGEVLAKLGQRDGAEKSYRRACELNPNSAWSWHNLGEVLEQQGNLDEAVAAYRKSVEIYPDFYEFHNRSGKALCFQGQLDESVSCLQEAIERRGQPGKIEGVPDFLGHFIARYKIADYKRVSIIIPTRDLGDVLDNCLESIFTKSVYPNYEVIVIDNGSQEQHTAGILAKWTAKESARFKSYRLDIPFNFSKINNYAASKAEGDYLLFLNNDTEVITPHWIDAMVEQAQRSWIGAVGNLLIYSDNKIQHAGVVRGLGGGVAGHSYYHMPRSIPGYFGNVVGMNNVSAVTAACLMCRREVFESVGGFDEELTVAYNDVDLCLKMLEKGYRNIYLPHVVLYHHESKSRGYEDSPEKKERLRKESKLIESRWQKYIDNDPYYSPHLTRACQDSGIRLEDKNWQPTN